MTIFKKHTKHSKELNFWVKVGGGASAFQNTDTHNTQEPKENGEEFLDIFFK